MIYFSLFDKSLNLYNPPFVESTNERAKQVVRNLLLTSDDKILQKLINDIDLVCVGVFDEVSGTFYSDRPDFICHLSDIPLPSIPPFADVGSSGVEVWTGGLSDLFSGGDNSEKLS